MKTTKKVATIQRKFHENRNNVNAYVRFKVNKIFECNLKKLLSALILKPESQHIYYALFYFILKELQSAIDSCQLNGTEIDSHIIRVDMAGLGKSASKDGKISQQHDQNKAVFLGNVKFNEHEDNIRKHFNRCGTITDVRLVRDTATGIGKGFGYVNFDGSDAVEKV